ncbi:MAG: ParB/RepB/Spo0J family partition protein [Sulfuricella denitrificans]|nr:ParB/RepB/Spo0J family partition protein [Sulfuricella denitrificans]
MVKHKGLGRGLDALLAGDDGEANEMLQQLAISALQPGKYQPRTHMDPESLQQLADSIRAQGVMQPVLVRPLASGRYEIIAGERRWRASQMAGLVEIPALVREIPDEAALAMALIENIQRENLNPLEEALGIQRLVNEFHLTHQAAAEAVSRSRSAVTNLLRLLNLAPRVQEMLMQNLLDMGHARALLGLTQVNQIDAAHEIINKGLSVREAEKLAQRLNKPAEERKPAPDRDVLRLQEELAEKLGARVTLTPRKGGRGRLAIEYENLDQLDSIIARF